MRISVTCFCSLSDVFTELSASQQQLISSYCGPQACKLFITVEEGESQPQRWQLRKGQDLFPLNKCLHEGKKGKRSWRDLSCSISSLSTLLQLLLVKLVTIIYVCLSTPFVLLRLCPLSVCRYKCGASAFESSYLLQLA